MLAAQPHTRTASLAEYFLGRPGVWIDGKALASIAGAYAWRSRVSDLRRSPYRLNIRNRQRLVVAADGQTYRISEYRLENQPVAQCAMA